jgi:GUN4-like
MYSTKFQVTQAHLLQAQQERIKILSELEQVKQMQVQLKFQLEQVLSLVKPLQGLQLFDPSILQSQLWEIQAQLIKDQEERFREIALELAESQAQKLVQTRLPQPEEQKHLSPSFLSELPKSQFIKDQWEELQSPTKMFLEVVPSANSNLANLIAEQAKFIDVKSINYTKLQNLLAASQWKEADAETQLIMLKVANREQQGKFEQEDFQNFACESLHSIDQLWLEYSQGHFGFTVQKRIFEKVGGKPGVNDYKAYCRFGEEVGWLVKNHWLLERDFQFSLQAFRGHLPIAPFASLMRDIRARKSYFGDFFSRLGTCNLS